MNSPEGLLWGELIYEKEPLPKGPHYSLRDVYTLTLMWEMQFRRLKEKLTFAFMLRESVMNPHAKSPTDTALDSYIEAVAPFIEEEQRAKRKKMFEVLEEETKTVFKVSPVQLPTRKVVPFTKPKRKK